MQIGPRATSAVASLTRSGRALAVNQLPVCRRSTVAATHHGASISDASSQDAARPADWDTAKPYSEIPGPKPIPVLGNVWRFFPAIGEFNQLNFKDLAQALVGKHGPIVKLAGMPGRPDMVFVTCPDATGAVYRNEGVWPIRDGGEAFTHVLTNLREDINVTLLASQGKEWQDFRTAVNQVMMQPRNVRIYTKPFNIVANEFIQRMIEIRDNNGEMPDNFSNELNKFSLEAITYAALDTRLGTLADELPPDSEAQQMIQGVHDVFEGVYKLDFEPSIWQWVSTPAYRKMFRAMDTVQKISHKYVLAAMERLKNTPKAELEKKDLSVLERLLIQNEDPGTGVSMALDMLFAGVDTTAALIGSSLYGIATHPEKQRLLLEELDRVIPDPNQPITWQQLEEMKYLRACVKESNRMVPVVLGNGRTAVKDLTLSGYQIPKGTRMVLNHGLMSQNEKYVPQANEFLPERWLAGGERLKPKSPFVFQPFGFGPRKCVGKRFADLETEILLAKIFRSYRLEWNHPPVEADVKMLLVFKSPLKFKVVERS